MKVLILVVLVALLLVPGVVGAVDTLGCDAWLESGNILAWAVCRVVGWVAFNQQMDVEYEYGFMV